ncbi:PKD domain-containing protein, partial [Candidatus Marithioploca araucensis]|nr:PKD domain-containing protein [Candidatus Marithioploca araucensis]
EIRTFAGHTSSVYSVVFSPDGRYALSGSSDDTLKLWDVNTGAEIRTFAGHTSSVYSVVFSPDGRYALSGSSDDTLKLWDVNTGAEIRTFAGHTYWINSVAFSPDGSYAFSGSYDRTLKMWETGIPINQPPQANFSLNPSSGIVPLSVHLDANASSDEGSLVRYQWTSSDGQAVEGVTADLTFSQAGAYTITLTVTDNEGATGTLSQNVTVELPPFILPTADSMEVGQSQNLAPTQGTAVSWHSADTAIASVDNSGYVNALAPGDVLITATDAYAQTANLTLNVTAPVTPPIASNAKIEFKGLEAFYDVGETIVMELVETVNRDKYTRVDLWVAIQLPSEAFVFRTDIPLNPWSPNQQPHKTSIENIETSHYIFDFDVPEGMGGDYTLYAVYVKEGENPVTNGFAIRSNLVMQKIVLANRKE